MIAVVRPSSTSTSGLPSDGMNPCTNALYVSLIIRCHSAAMVPNISDDSAEPQTPVNTVSRRLGIWTQRAFRWFSRAPWTRIRSWLSAGCLLEAGMFALISSRCTVSCGRSFRRCVSSPTGSLDPLQQLDELAAHQVPAVASAAELLLLVGLEA